MDSLFKKAADFAQDYASGQGQQGQQQQHQGQQQQQQQQQNQGMPGGFGGLAQQFLGGNSGQQQQQQSQVQGQGQGQGGFGGQQQQYGGSSGGGEANQFYKTGGPEFNAPHGSGGASQNQGSNSGFALPFLNQDQAISQAKADAGDQDSSLFSSALGFLKGFNKDDNDIDEEKVVQQHQQVYDQGKAGQMSASSIGSAAALQAMKNFMGGGGQQQQQQQSSGGGLQSKLTNEIIGMALSEAAKMFDKSGGAASGTKQDAVNSAGATIMKLLLKSQFSGAQTTGGSNSGGLGQLMGMASKFL